MDPSDVKFFGGKFGVWLSPEGKISPGQVWARNRPSRPGQVSFSPRNLEFKLLPDLLLPVIIWTTPQQHLLFSVIFIHGFLFSRGDFLPALPIPGLGHFKPKWGRVRPILSQMANFLHFWIALELIQKTKLFFHNFKNWLNFI